MSLLKIRTSARWAPPKYECVLTHELVDQHGNVEAVLTEEDVKMLDDEAAMQHNAYMEAVEQAT